MTPAPDARPRILIVDDTDANLFTLEALLGGMPCDLVRASSGNQALRQLLGGPFALILLDVRMPDMDGYEVARHARANPATADVPIIFLSAAEERGDHGLHAMGAAPIDFLLKPFDANELRRKVRAVLERSATFTDARPDP